MKITDLYAFCKAAGVTDDGIKITHLKGAKSIVVTCRVDPARLDIADDLAPVFGLRPAEGHLPDHASYEWGTAESGFVLIRFYTGPIQRP